MSSKPYFVHPSSYVDEGVEIGAGSKIWHFSHIMAGARIGEDCNIGQNVFIGPKVSIGNRVKIQNNVSIYQGVEIEDGVFCGPSMVFTNVLRPRSEFPKKKDEYTKTIVKKGTMIGANATILAGITLGRYCFVGAGAVVTKDIPDFGVCYGNPARLNGWCCICGQTLKMKGTRARCHNCAREYVISDSVCKITETV